MIPVLSYAIIPGYLHRNEQMIISRHIIYTDYPEICYHHELVFDPPIDIDSPLGKIRPLYTRHEGISGANKSTLGRIKPIINQNNILHPKELVTEGDILTIRLRTGHLLRNIVLDCVHQLQVMPDEGRMQYWITVGRAGAIEITGEMVRDKEGVFSKLRSNLKDIPYRAYIVQSSLADSKVTAEAIDRDPDLMNTREAADYLRISTSTLYKKAQSGEIGRTRNKKFRREELDRYLRGEKKRK